jgi:Cu/Zn superoxide dismutase
VCHRKDANEDLVTAVAVLQPTSNCNAGCSGTVWLTDTPQGVQVVASVAGLKLNTKHGFHIHQVTCHTVRAD